MNVMSDEELKAMAVINKRLSDQRLKSRLSRLYISGIKDGSVTEWEWQEILPEEGAKPSIIVSDSIRQLLDS